MRPNKQHKRRQEGKEERVLTIQHPTEELGARKTPKRLPDKKVYKDGNFWHLPCPPDLIEMSEFELLPPDF